MCDLTVWVPTQPQSRKWSPRYILLTLRGKKKEVKRRVCFVNSLLFLYLFVPHSCFSPFVCFFLFLLSSLLPSTVIAPWLSWCLSNTSKGGKVCGAADNALYPQAPASSSRAPTQFLNWQVWPLLCLVENASCFSHFFSDVFSGISVLQHVSDHTRRCSEEPRAWMYSWITSSPLCIICMLSRNRLRWKGVTCWYWVLWPAIVSFSHRRSFYQIPVKHRDTVIWTLTPDLYFLFKIQTFI